MAEEESIADALLNVWRAMAAAGRPMPPESELAQQLGASRSQVRELLIRLEADGLVRREQGAGTFVNPAASNLRFRLDRAREFAVALADAGYEPTVEVVSASVVEPTAEIVAALDLRETEAVIETVKRWSADGSPAMVARDLVPVRRNAAIPEGMSHSVFEIAQERGRGSADWLHTEVSAVIPPPDIVAALQLEPGVPVIRLDQIGWSKFGPKVFLSVDHYHPHIVRFDMLRTVGR